MRKARGPSGAAAPPPHDLPARSLPLAPIPAGKALFRVHRTVYAPIFFGPDRASGRLPVFRFDAASGRFGVLYLAPTPDAALIETLLRNPERQTVSYREIRIRSLSALCAGRDLALVDMTGPGLSRLGVTAALSSGPYEVCGQWADALFDHPQAPDGILYPSRHNPAETCIALFARSDQALSLISTTELSQLSNLVGAVLDHHGKSLFGAP